MAVIGIRRVVKGREILSGWGFVCNTYGSITSGHDVACLRCIKRSVGAFFARWLDGVTLELGWLPRVPCLSSLVSCVCSLYIFCRDLDVDVDDARHPLPLGREI